MNLSKRDFTYTYICEHSHCSKAPVANRKRREPKEPTGRSKDHPSPTIDVKGKLRVFSRYFTHLHATPPPPSSSPWVTHAMFLAPVSSRLPFLPRPAVCAWRRRDNFAASNGPNYKAMRFRTPESDETAREKRPLSRGHTRPER